MVCSVQWKVWNGNKNLNITSWKPVDVIGYRTISGFYYLKCLHMCTKKCYMYFSRKIQVYTKLQLVIFSKKRTTYYKIQKGLYILRTLKSPSSLTHIFLLQVCVFMCYFHAIAEHSTSQKSAEIQYWPKDHCTSFGIPYVIFTYTNNNNNNNTDIPTESKQKTIEVVWHSKPLQPSQY